MYISHVCRSWRGVSLSSGALWSHLSIKFTDRYKSKEWEAMVEVFDTWLQRTNGSALNFMIYFALRKTDDDRIHRMSEYVVTTFLAHQRRWRDVVLRCFGLLPSSEFAGINAIDMPMLTSLALDVIFSGYQKMCTVCVGESPLLKHLQVGDAFDLETSDGAGQNLSEASRSLLRTRYSLHNATRLCLDLLKATPCMTAIRFMYRATLDKEVETEMTTSNLKALMLPPEGSNQIINKLTLPSLKILRCGRPFTLWTEVGFLDFTRRSMPPLTHLRLFSEDEDTLIPALHLLPTLQVLSLENTRVSAKFFQALALTTDTSTAAGTVDTSRSNLCPALLSLRLHGLYMWDDTDAFECVKAMLMMFKSRENVLTRRNKIVEENLGMSDRQIQWVLNDFRIYVFSAAAEVVPLGPGRFWPDIDM
ncbi:uncharacterized protein FOMMEDRAFT_145642 [Fomitiporia mediterranea MF3/22]|uniref:uncharacterized protein n=1 Tax=Fomitiporia mediterranea (strain MF3/22) TaxID=694068 RepID=UPI000440852F|nr:uncharacterized protein FOMMEDRAFT_145642 [Fomitiporia mediterranea MF3/22]EJD04958.1 hypothetical protein FOMMEDRAFT_145642 [Fomitiporia mediterranea MF3/22]